MATFVDTNHPGPAAASNNSEAAKAGLNLTLQPLEHFIFAGLQKKLFDVFDLRSAWLASTDKAKVLQRMFGNPAAGTNDLAIQYPYAFLTVASMNADPTPTLNTQYTATVGITNVLQGDDPRAFRVTFLPCEFTINVEYVTDSQQKLLDFSSRWLMSRRLGWLKFNVHYGRTAFSIVAQAEGSLSLPQREGDLENSPVYSMTTTLVVQGYISNPTMLEQQVVDHVVASVAVPSNTPEGAVFWSFNSRTGTETGPP
jgi:hypothetical protein